MYGKSHIPWQKSWYKRWQLFWIFRQNLGSECQNWQSSSNYDPSLLKHWYKHFMNTKLSHWYFFSTIFVGWKVDFCFIFTFGSEGKITTFQSIQPEPFKICCIISRSKRLLNFSKKKDCLNKCQVILSWLENQPTWTV